MKFHEILPSRSQVAPCRQTEWTDAWTDRHEEANSCFLQFCEHAQKKVNTKQIAAMCNNGKTQVYNSLNATQKINHMIN